MATSSNRTPEARGLHIFSFVLGVWIVAAPLFLGYSHAPATINSVLVGITIAVLSFIRLRSTSDTWASWTLVGMGLWLAFSPFIFGYTKTATYWNELVVGLALIVAMFSALGQSIRHHSHLVH